MLAFCSYLVWPHRAPNMAVVYQPQIFQRSIPWSNLTNKSRASTETSHHTIIYNNCLFLLILHFRDQDLTQKQKASRRTTCLQTLHVYRAVLHSISTISLRKQSQPVATRETRHKQEWQSNASAPLERWHTRWHHHYIRRGWLNELWTAYANHGTAAES